MKGSWTSEDETSEMRSRWRTLTVEEIRNHKEEAGEKVAEAMKELYLATGIYFHVSAKIVTQDELNSQTQWVARYSYAIALVGQI